MLAAVYYPDTGLPNQMQDLIKAGANIGCVVGQLLFGLAADSFGRSKVYGKELCVIILATIVCICVPSTLSPHNVLLWIFVCRIILGIGVGGDYPMSATVVSDRANIHRRGTLLCFIFANQGWGSFVGSLVTLVILACFKSTLKAGNVHAVDKIWRLVIGLSLIPAFGTLYQRLTLPESRKFQLTREAAASASASASASGVSSIADDKEKGEKGKDSSSEDVKGAVVTENQPVHEERHGVVVSKRAHYKEFISYFSTWSHLKVLLGTTLGWFLVDIAFYGINLNQSVVLQQIGYGGKKGDDPFDKLFTLATGNIIVTALGFLPGYYFTLFTIDIIGRKWLQFGGFLASALFLAIMAGEVNHLGKGPLIACFTFLQFSFNFGANTTTFIVAAESFPTRIRATAHGLSAACGKLGAILSSLVFNQLKAKIGTSNVLWIFFATAVLGALSTLLIDETMGVDPDEKDEAERRAKGEIQ
ncbi:phosphate transporter [Serendipita vermifera]|nr:phosphate transporter [Serendipita vermifera]